MSHVRPCFDHLRSVIICSDPISIELLYSLFVRFAGWEPTPAQVVKFDVEAGQTRMWHEPGSICLGAYCTAPLYASAVIPG